MMQNESKIDYSRHYPGAVTVMLIVSCWFIFLRTNYASFFAWIGFFFAIGIFISRKSLSNTVCVLISILILINPILIERPAIKLRFSFDYYFMSKKEININFTERFGVAGVINLKGWRTLLEPGSTASNTGYKVTMITNHVQNLDKTDYIRFSEPPCVTEIVSLINSGFFVSFYCE